MDPKELRERARRYRQTAALVTDAETSEALLDLAKIYEEMADQRSQAGGADHPIPE